MKRALLMLLTLLALGCTKPGQEHAHEHDDRPLVLVTVTVSITRAAVGGFEVMGSHREHHEADEAGRERGQRDEEEK